MSNETWMPVKDEIIKYGTAEFRQAADGLFVALQYGQRVSAELPDDLRLCRLVPDNRPRADWSTAPEWAMWWAVQPGGEAYWFERRPEIAAVSQDHWLMNDDDNDRSEIADGVNIPSGVDWRELVEMRPNP